MLEIILEIVKKTNPDMTMNKLLKELNIKHYTGKALLININNYKK